MENKIPQASARRLPLYYRFLSNLHDEGKTRVSSKELSNAVKVDPATIRRDFSYFGALGKKGYGYNVEYLLAFFKKTLEQDEITEVALIGVGNLGTALLNYNFLRNNNTKISMAFDRSKSKAKTHINGVPIYHVNELEKKLQSIDVVILTIPASETQEMANRLVKSGVKGILNFTPARLTLPDDVRIHHIDLSVEIQSLVYFLKHYSIETEAGINEINIK